MSIETAERRALAELDFRLNVLLPEEYQGAYDEVQPVSMGSAGLKFDATGQVEWDQMWQTFCDLAMAGGPPHKGTLLEPGSHADLAANPDAYASVVHEICRGILMATELPVVPSTTGGWVEVDCHSETMADWLLRAIVMENVAVRRGAGRTLLLPASPAFRLEKEIKNVITVMAKTCHYWAGHIPRGQKRAIADLLVTLAAKGVIVEPELPGATRADIYDRASEDLAAAIRRHTDLMRSPHRYHGWLGFECATVRAAIWMMRALVASNVLSRREGTTLFVPLCPARDAGGIIVSQVVAEIHRLAGATGVLQAQAG